MNAKLALPNNNSAEQIDVVQYRTGFERLIPALTALGIIASFVAFLSMREAIITQAKPDPFATSNIPKSQLYYVAHGCEILLLISAGLISLLCTDLRTIRRGYPLCLVLLAGAALLMASRGYALPDLLSTKLVDWTGPVPFLLSLLIFIGASKSNWRFISKTMVIVAVVFSASTLLGLTGMQSLTRQEGITKLGISLTNLYWPASWIALRQYGHTSPWRHLRFAPIVIYIWGSFFTQTRLNFVMIFALVGVYGYLQYQRRMPQAVGWIGAILVGLWAVLFTATFLRSSRTFETLNGVAANFSSRLDEDTRTGQLVSFAESVEPQELLLGRGSLATWYWSGNWWGGGTDVGYLTLLLYGGLPLFLTYIGTHVTACLGVLRSNTANWQLTAAGVVFLWGIRLFSSDYPSMTIGYYLVLFCVGACISRNPFEQGPHCLNSGALLN